MLPIGQGSGSGLFEYVAAVEMTLVVEMVVDRGMHGGEFLQGLNEDNPVASILIDLAQRDTMNRSVRFAETVLTSLSQSTYVRPTTPRRSAGFAVLKAPDVPAVLIELGYLTNQTDESEMATDAWRSRVAGSITSAIDGYFGVGTSSESLQAAIP